MNIFRIFRKLLGPKMSNEEILAALASDGPKKSKIRITYKLEPNSNGRWPCMAIAIIDGHQLYGFGDTWDQARGQLLETIRKNLENQRKLPPPPPPEEHWI